MPRFRTALAALAAATALTTLVGVAPASATAVADGYCATVPGLVEFPDGSFDITNDLSGAGLMAGCVTTHHVPGVSTTFGAAFTYPGWTFKVKDAGGTGKNKVSVAFIDSATGTKITYTIQPGRLDWRVS